MAEAKGNDASRNNVVVKVRARVQFVCAGGIYIIQTAERDRSYKSDTTERASVSAPLVD